MSDRFYENFSKWYDQKLARRPNPWYTGAERIAILAEAKRLAQAEPLRKAAQAQGLFDAPIYLHPAHYAQLAQDLAEHSYDGCWCRPTLDDAGYILHRAFDQRELVEQGVRRVQ